MRLAHAALASSLLASAAFGCSAEDAVSMEDLVEVEDSKADDYYVAAGCVK